MDKYFWSFNEYDEYWGNSAETVEECIEIAKDEVTDYEEQEEIEKGEVNSVFIGELKIFKPTICVDRVIDNIIDDAYDKVGEIADGFLDDMSKERERELEEELNKTLDRWLDKHKLRPNFGTIENIKEYKFK